MHARGVELLGWWVGRRNARLRPSARDATVHAALCNVLADGALRRRTRQFPPLLGVFSLEVREDGRCTHSMSYSLLRGQPTPLQPQLPSPLPAPHRGEGEPIATARHEHSPAVVRFRALRVRLLNLAQGSQARYQALDGTWLSQPALLDATMGPEPSAAQLDGGVDGENGGWSGGVSGVRPAHAARPSASAARVEAFFHRVVAGTDADLVQLKRVESEMASLLEQRAELENRLQQLKAHVQQVSSTESSQQS